jgi:hypothetical protein
MRRLMQVFLAVAVLALFATPAARADQYFRGCLVGTHDNYMLRTDDGQLYRLHSHDEDDFRSHLGEMVEIKGNLSDHKREREAQVDTPAAAQAGVEIPKHGINVSKVKGLSTGCADVVNGVATYRVKPGAVVVAPGSTKSGTVVVAPGSTVVTPGATSLPQSTVVTENGQSEQHFVGCLVGTEDFFVLKADDGTLYRLRNHDDLKQHVGETVDVTGRIDNSKREIDAQKQAELAQKVGVQIPDVGVNVSNLKTLAKGCSTPRQ